MISWQYCRNGSDSHALTLEIEPVGLLAHVAHVSIPSSIGACRKAPNHNLSDYIDFELFLEGVLGAPKGPRPRLPGESPLPPRCGPASRASPGCGDKNRTDRKAARVGPGRPTELLQADDDGRRIPDDAEAAHVQATITLAEANRLDGKQGRFVVQLDGPATPHGNNTLYEVVVAGANELGKAFTEFRLTDAVRRRPPFAGIRCTTAARVKRAVGLSRSPVPLPVVLPCKMPLDPPGRQTFWPEMNFHPTATTAAFDKGRFLSFSLDAGNLRTGGGFSA